MTTHAGYVESLKHSAVSVGTKLLVKEVAARLPFLFVPILNPLTTMVLERLVRLLVLQTEFAVFFKYIDMRVDAQGRDFSRAALNNYHTQREGTPEQKKEAEERLIKAFTAFVVLKR